MNQKQPLVQAFTNIHTALRNDLKSLDNTVQRKGKLSNRDLEGLQKWFNFYWTHLENHHHGEDTYFYPIIAERDASFLPEMEKLTAEHHELTNLAEKIKAAFARLPQLPVGAERDYQTRQFAELISTLNKTLLNHLAVEEAIMFPSIVNHFSVEDQAPIDQRYVKRQSLKELSQMVPWFMANLTEEQQADVKANAPWILKFLYYNFWQKKYNKFVASYGV